MSEGSTKRTEGRRKRNPRHDYRARSHESAHAQDEGKPATIPELPLVARNQPALVSTESEVGELIEHLRTEERFAYDSEFIGELTYHPKICVIQVATASRLTTEPLVSLAIAAARVCSFSARPGVETSPLSTSALSTELTLTFSPGARARTDWRTRDRS